MTEKANPFDFVNAINKSKENLFETRNYTDSDYNKFIVNRAMSQYSDTIFIANEANKTLNNIPNKSHFNFYRFIVPSKKRYSKWGKADISKKVETIMQYYDYSLQRALEVESIFSEDDIKNMKEIMDTGGRKRG